MGNGNTPILVHGRWSSQVLSHDKAESIRLRATVRGRIPVSVEVQGPDGPIDVVRQGTDRAFTLVGRKAGDYVVSLKVAGNAVFPQDETADLSLEVRRGEGGANDFRVESIPVGGLSRAELVVVQVDDSSPLSMLPAEIEESHGMGGWLANRMREGRGPVPALTVSTFYVDTSASMDAYASEVTYLHDLIGEYCQTARCHLPEWESLEVGGVAEGGVGVALIPDPFVGPRGVLITDLPSSRANVDNLVFGNPEVANYFGGPGAAAFWFALSEKARQEGDGAALSDEEAEKLMALVRWLCEEKN